MSKKESNPAPPPIENKPKAPNGPPPPYNGKLILLVLLLVFPRMLCALDCPIDVSFDRFNQSTSYSTPMELTIGQRMSVVFHSVVIGDEVSSRLLLARAGSSLRYDSCPIVQVLVDGKRSNLSFTYKVSAMDSSIVELFSAYLSLDQFSKLANAQKVEYKVCNDEFEIPAAVLCTGKDIYQRVKV